MKKLKVQEMIAIGVYSTIYFFVVSLVMVLLKFTVPVFDSLLLPGAIALFSGVIYLSLLIKAPHFGAITIMGSVMALVFLLTGHFPLSFLPTLLFSVGADLIQYKTHLPEKIRTTLSYTVFCFGNTGPLLFMWFMKNAYVNALVARGKDQAYIDHVFAPMTTAGFFICAVTIIIGAIFGMMIGRKLLAKHFQHVQA